ncbi:uncharacterized protein KY384_003817 [Bacidia gigantensis]|uniref:uncharacterized protein n=1 Tax=Bacidia gigantensis TaxID=2732470 RepID=UPI001D053234|nr:uncharacterized protein KY384_003817 [Bacidia gigantensis]KAG8532177.1 hypothetical protein KY384_003817 [Bacidia gigantensis]
MAPPQKPETFMLSDAAQQSLPQDAQVALQQVDNLKYFLISAPVDWTPDQYIRRFLLPTGEYVSCVLWNNLFHISGTDIVRCLSFRFQAFGRPVKNSKKFEEGIFSDLRNLKSGTDASLEEPKSPFLDFMYKNNCIRTQKKQKVFYWYSVPHDRLFLDALERDLKREKMGQEATTMAVSEPALSFEFDASQSLFEQLTKAQQASSSSFSANASSAYSQSTSPVLRASDSMPPPSLPQPLPTVSEDVPATIGAYPQVSVAPSAASNFVKRETDYGHLQYDRNGIPLSRVHQRHTSMPTYMEYSPAPSFVSSQGEYGTYSNRDLSFEPVTPPQSNQVAAAEPAYIANEDTGLYSAIPDVNSSQSYNMMTQLPPSNLSGGQYSGSRNYGSGNVYSVIEGSPTYKQRRRRSSIPPNTNAMAAAATGHAPHRQSDLRRSVSASLGPDEGDDSGRNSPPALPNGYANMIGQHRDMLEHISRHGTPLQQTVEGSPAPQNMGMMQAQENNYHGYQDNLQIQSTDTSPGSRGGDRPGPVRRARSATMMELGPYPHKSHSCPIPTCGRLFKRLEHLKRHVRTHTQERPYVCPHCNKAFSRSDNLAQHRRTHEVRPDGEVGGYTDDDLEAEENEFGTLEDESPPPENNNHYAQNPMAHMTANAMRLPSNGMAHDGMSMAGSMGPPMMGGGIPVSQQI